MRELTRDEVRSAFVDGVWDLVKFWRAQKGDETEKMAGLAYGILSLLDGEAPGLPHFCMFSDPTVEDTRRRESQGLPAFPHVLDPELDVSKDLGDAFQAKRLSDGA